MSKSKEGYTNLPEDFFNDLVDEEFIEDVVERIEDVVEQHDDDDPQLNRCLDEIKELEAKIEKKKRNILERQNGLTVEERLRQKAMECERMSRSRSRSRDRERRPRERRARRGSRGSRSRSPHGSRHRDRRHNRDRSLSPFASRGSHRSRGSRSKSPKRSKRSASTHRNISFLEELAQKFAEKGQAFPEKDALLMGHNQMNNNQPMNMNGPPMPMDFANAMPNFEPQPLISIPNFQPQQVSYPMQGVQPVQQSMFYGINPMSILAGNVPSVPSNNLGAFPGLNIPPIELPVVRPENRIQQMPIAQPIATGTVLTDNQRASIRDRCEHAIKQIRAKDNKVPIMKFLYNRTSLVVSNANDISAVNAANNKSPLQAHSPLNVQFKLNAPPSSPIKPVNGLKMLPKRVKDIAQALGIRSSLLFDKMRTKELNAQIQDQIRSEMVCDDSDAATSSSATAGGKSGSGSGDGDGEILFQTTTVPTPIIERKDMAIQTNELKCEKCVERNRRTMVSAHTQVFLKNFSIGTQTNEKDYREPIVELLSKMSAAQLVAIKDFTCIISEPRARSEMDYARVRERLIDIYNLSQRDADTVREAEENQIDEISYMDLQQSRLRGPGSVGPADAYGDGPPRDFVRRPNSPRFNGTPVSERGSFGAGGNFEPSSFGNDRGGVMDDRMPMPRGMMNERFSRLDDPYQRQRMLDEEREEREREKYIEMERRREMELELSQRQYDEMRMEQERRAMQMQNFQPQPNHPFDDDRRSFNRDTDGIDRDAPRSFNNANRGSINRRGRGAFRGRGARR